MVERFRCLICGHTWKARGGNPASTQCPQCRRHRFIDDAVFDQAVTDLVHFFRKMPPEDPLAEFSTGLDRAREIIWETFPDPLLAGQAAFEVVREALARLGFPRPPRLLPLP